MCASTYLLDNTAADRSVFPKGFAKDIVTSATPDIPSELTLTEVLADIFTSTSVYLVSCEEATPEIYLEPQEEGGFVAFSAKYPGAVGQGETEEEAIKDLEEAVQLLEEVLEENRRRQ